MVMSQKVISTYLHRCELNKDCLLNLYYFGSLPRVNLMTIASSNDEEEDHQWMGLLNSLKKHINMSNQIILSSQQKKYNDTMKVIADMRSEIRQEQLEMEKRAIERYDALVKRLEAKK